MTRFTGKMYFRLKSNGVYNRSAKKEYLSLSMVEEN